MKSVIAAAVLLILTVVFCLSAAARTVSEIDRLYAMTEQMPVIAEVCLTDTERVRACADRIAADWSRAVSYFSYVCGYNVLNRADEAVWNLYAAVGAGDYASAIQARYQLLDALRRMRELERISLSSVF